jgi:hypothetical protein
MLRIQLLTYALLADSLYAQRIPISRGWWKLKYGLRRVRTWTVSGGVGLCGTSQLQCGKQMPHGNLARCGLQFFPPAAAKSPNSNRDVTLLQCPMLNHTVPDVFTNTGGS